MKIKLKTTIKDYEGKVIQWPTGDAGAMEDVHYRKIINSALNTDVQGQVLTAEDKEQIYQISKKVWDSWTPDLTNVECAYIQKRGDDVLPAPLRRRLNDFLNGRGEVASTES